MLKLLILYHKHFEHNLQTDHFTSTALTKGWWKHQLNDNPYTQKIYNILYPDNSWSATDKAQAQLVQ